MTFDLDRFIEECRKGPGIAIRLHRDEVSDFLRELDQHGGRFRWGSGGTRPSDFQPTDTDYWKSYSCDGEFDIFIEFNQTDAYELRWQMSWGVVKPPESLYISSRRLIPMSAVCADEIPNIPDMLEELL